jgi:hypothetical protein
MACPKCGSDRAILIEVTAWAELTVDGTDPDEYHHWTDDSQCQCGKCLHHATVGEFRIDECS